VEHEQSEIAIRRGVDPMRKRRQFFPMTPLREMRFRAGLVLSEVARTAEMSLTRASILERDPGLAHPGEVEALERAIRLLAAPRGR
jgi:hypothetical protein